jgi:hypothetical protein
MAVDPNSLTDPKQVRTLLENAKRAGRNDLVLQCQARLAKLDGARFKDDLEREFWAEELATEKNGKTTRLNRTRQKAARVGIKKCLEDWAFHKGTTQGFDILVEGGHPELTGEAIVTRHAAEFSIETVQAARNRLKASGIDPDKV